MVKARAKSFENPLEGIRWIRVGYPSLFVGAILAHHEQKSFFLYFFFSQLALEIENSQIFSLSFFTSRMRYSISLPSKITRQLIILVVQHWRLRNFLSLSLSLSLSFSLSLSKTFELTCKTKPLLAIASLPTKSWNTFVFQHPTNTIVLPDQTIHFTQRSFSIWNYNFPIHI